MENNQKIKFKTEFISDKTVKNFLKKNNISLEKIGDESKQNEYISRLSKALLEYKDLRRNNDTENIFPEMKSAIGKLGMLMQEAEIPNNVADKLMKNFIPETFPNKKQQTEIAKLKEQIESLKKENEELNKKLEDSKTDLPKENKTKSRIDVIETRGETTDKRDETYKDVLKRMGDTLKNLNEQRKEAKSLSKKESISLKDPRYVSIGEGAKNILIGTYDFWDYHLRNYGIENAGHDLLTAIPAFAVGTTIATGYVAGRVVGKAIKGAITLTGKAGKLVFKAVKGTAAKCKNKTIEYLEQRKEKKLDREFNALEEMDDATNKIFKFSEEKLNDLTIKSDDFINLTPKQQGYLKEIRSEDTRETAENDILNENNELLIKAKKQLIDISLKGVSQELQNKFNLKASEAKTFINNLKLDENGELIISEESPITLEEIEQAGLDDRLKNVIQIPKVKDFDFVNIMEIADALYAKSESENKLNELIAKGKISYKSSKFVQAMSESDILYDGFVDDLDKLGQFYDEWECNSIILLEAYARDEFNLAKELRTQSMDITHEYAKIYDENSIKHNHRKDQLRKIAEAKVNNLKDENIIEVIQDGEEKQIGILEQAKRALSQDLAESLENTIEIKREKINPKNKENDDSNMLDK